MLIVFFHSNLESTIFCKN